jgi:hypothetical protein
MIQKMPLAGSTRDGEPLGRRPEPAAEAHRRQLWSGAARVRLAVSGTRSDLPIQIAVAPRRCDDKPGIRR